jgi:UDP-glucuronate 4-epimerase
LPTTGLRFFTVYGPWGRPDMALSLFAKAMIAGNPIDIFNHGIMERAFTFIDDVVDAIVQVLHCVAEPATEYDSKKPDPATSNAPYKVLNVGSDQSVSLRIYIESLEQALGITAEKNYLPLQDGDIPTTNADIAEITALIGWAPKIKVPDGVQRFAAWYREYHDNNKS